MWFGNARLAIREPWKSDFVRFSLATRGEETMRFEKELRLGLTRAQQLLPRRGLVARGALAVEGADARSAAAVCARTMASRLENLWKESRTAGHGPIDVIDLFSGCGGMSAGFAAANALGPFFKLVAAADIDPVANRTYEANLGVRPHAADVSQLARDERRLQDWIRRTDRRPSHPLVFIGCAPCQGFSSHRNSNGLRDPRNSLVIDFARIARSLKPDVVIMENVPEILTEAYWGVLQAARETLVGSGYRVHVSVHNMAGFGLPQERFRALVVAMRRPFTPVLDFLTRDRFRTVRQAIGWLPAVGAGQVHPEDAMHYSAGHAESTLRTIRAVAKDGGNRPANVGPECLRRIARRQGRGAYEDVYGRLRWDRPAITITAYARNPASGRFVHPEQDRGLTVREAALLQGFPPDYWFAGSLDQRFRQIGNAVPPRFSAYLALHVLGELLRAPRAESAIDYDRGIVRPVGKSFSRLIPALKAGTRVAVA